MNEFEDALIQETDLIIRELGVSDVYEAVAKMREAQQQK